MTYEPSHRALLEQYARLPESYQPIWGIEASREMASRVCEDRLAAMLPLIERLPSTQPLRILDVGCAQGYFSFALKQRLTELGREAEVIGVDYLDANVAFCQDLAAYHGLHVRFIHDRFDSHFFERHELGEFDIVLALNVLHHIRQLDGAEAASGALSAVEKHSRLLLCEIAQSSEALNWVDSWHGSDQELLHAYAFRRKLAEFSTHLTSVERPLYACSNRIAWVEKQWIPFSRALDRSHAGVAAAFAGQRSFLFGNDVIIKCYRGTGPHAAFNREDFTAEKTALAALSGDVGRYPEILASEDAGESLWLARRMLPGQLVSEYLNSDGPHELNRVVRGLLVELAQLEQRGFYHSDIRCWNALWHEGEVRLIDFGAITSLPSPMHRVALAAVLSELVQGPNHHPEPFYSSLQPLSAYPDEWRRLVRFLTVTSQEEFTYAGAIDAFEQGLLEGRHNGGGQTDYPAGEVLVALTHEHCAAFERLTGHAFESERVREVATRYVEDLKRELMKVGRDFAVDREATKNALGEAQRYTESLIEAMAVGETYRISLEHELGLAKERAEVSERYAASLLDVKERLESDYERELGAIKERAEVSERFASSLVDTKAKLESDNETLSGGLAKADELILEYERHIHAIVSECNGHISANGQPRAGSAGESWEGGGAEPDPSRVLTLMQAHRVEVRKLREERDGAYAQVSALRHRFRHLKALWPRGNWD